MVNTSEIIQSLQNWVCKEYKEVEINTSDHFGLSANNFGWSVTIELEIEELIVEKKILANFKKSEKNWCCCWTKNRKFRGTGGAENLADIICVLEEFTNPAFIEKVNPQLSKLDDPFTWLQNWYFSHSNGGHPRPHGISLKAKEGAWRVMFDLIETDVEDIIINPGLIHHSESDWISYSIVESQFHAVCSRYNLFYLITIFKNLVEYKGLE